mmetsp:Transcript_2841/g.2336  ORF Transcript_2841/g.2336 Transcript_2841/m.2336 type:complete len:139 (+) Transcript_2841:3-419(+)
MGHFGRGPIMLSWFGLVLPALIFCYTGQAAYVLAEGTQAAASNPFWSATPNALYIVMLVRLYIPTPPISMNHTIVIGPLAIPTLDGPRNWREYKSISKIRVRGTTSSWTTLIPLGENNLSVASGRLDLSDGMLLEVFC